MPKCDTRFLKFPSEKIKVALVRYMCSYAIVSQIYTTILAKRERIRFSN